MLSAIKINPSHYAIVVLFILHTVGIIGILFFNEDLIKLTPINLLISLIVVVAFQQKKHRLFFTYAVIVFVVGFLIEWLGIASEKIFGSYFYGNNLGIKFFDVPLIIGVNWLLLSYGSCNLMQQLLGCKTSIWFKILLASLAMVVADMLIEQVCQRLDFWYWKHNTVPIQNYVVWFIVALGFNAIYYNTSSKQVNKVAMWLFVFQVLFFVLLNLFLK